jgi:cardiolipin synthase
MQHVTWISTAVFLLDFLIRVGLSLRVIMRRLPVGTALAWLAVVLILPFAGAILYLLFGEYRLGRRRARRERELALARPDWFPSLPAPSDADWSAISGASTALARVIQSSLGCAPSAGNRLQLLENAEVAFPALVASIEGARNSCYMEFYIWTVGGCADDVALALIQAATRGVRCRVLVDAIGSAHFLRSKTARELRRSGVQLEAALPAGLFRSLLVRSDLRMHRKIAVIDGEISFTGSMNLADPRLFKQDAGVGQWVDALVRVEGPAVQIFSRIFLKDWALESSGATDTRDQESEAPAPAPCGRATVQVLPTGPDARVEATEAVLLTAVYAATREIVLTTPYFVPDEATLMALKSAAHRGVRVILIVPERVDSRLVHYASRAFQPDLLAAGVEIALFGGGLLHTKSITVDEKFSLFGSVNLDPRSLRLDFEITMAIYDDAFTAALRRLQQSYLDCSTMLDPIACGSRSPLERFAEDTARLVGPLL